MLIAKIGILLSSIIFFGNVCFAQQELNSKLGLNSELYNGKYYSYFLPRNVDGHQFLFSESFSIGTVWKNAEDFEDLLLNYDIVNQEIILKFETKLGAEKIIALSMTDLDSFSLNDKHFIVKKDISDDLLIFQKIEYGNYSFFFHFYKELKLQSQLNNISYQISKVNMYIYFSKDGVVNKITKNRSFLKQINEEKRKSVKKYMKSKKFKIQKMKDFEYLELLEFLQNNIDEKY